MVCEDNLTFTFVSPARDYDVHLLVIPRRHAPTILDLTDAETEALAHATRRAARALVDAYEAPGVNTFQNNGTASGQTVAHFHTHVVLRKVGDPWPPPPRVRITPEERDEIAARLHPHL